VQAVLELVATLMLVITSSSAGCIRIGSYNFPDASNNFTTVNAQLVQNTKIITDCSWVLDPGGLFLSAHANFVHNGAKSNTSKNQMNKKWFLLIS
jgi:hypothetical protein